MRYSKISSVLLTSLAAEAVNAHTTFTNFWVDDVAQGDGTCVRMNNNIQQATYPIPSVTGNDMACGE